MHPLISSGFDKQACPPSRPPSALSKKSSWRLRDSNSWPPACKAGALPTELIPHIQLSFKEVGLSGLEPPTSRLSGVRSNRLSYKPIVAIFKTAFAVNFLYKSGIHLLSRTVSSKVPSAACVLTIVFGMGTGVSHRRIDTRSCEHLISLHRRRI